MVEENKLENVESESAVQVEETEVITEEKIEEVEARKDKRPFKFDGKKYAKSKHFNPDIPFQLLE